MLFKTFENRNATPISDTRTFPEGRAATEPPEARGLRRDQVRLQILNRHTGEVAHTRFDKLGEFLQPGDLVVLNDSRTLPISLEATLPKGDRVNLRLTRSEVGGWVCYASHPLKKGSLLLVNRERLMIKLLQAQTAHRWYAALFSSDDSCWPAIYDAGQPMSYQQLPRNWDLEYFQTVYAAHPGSAEMPSAGRPLSWELLFKLKRKGIRIATITLHTALGPQDEEYFAEPPAEEYFISPLAANLINESLHQGCRLIAVGTTVVRALETVALSRRKIRPGHGWSRLHITSEYQLKIVDGVISGFHEQESSHLDLLATIVQREKLWAAYKIAIEKDYLWHEFGDAQLIL